MDCYGPRTGMVILKSSGSNKAEGSPHRSAKDVAPRLTDETDETALADGVGYGSTNAKAQRGVGEKAQSRRSFLSRSQGRVDLRMSQTKFRKSNLRDTIAVQSSRNFVNDDEVHAENPRLRDYLIPRNTVRVERPEGDEAGNEAGNEAWADADKESSACAAAAEAARKREKAGRKVRFDSVLVREYGMVLGDHPCCSYGPPVALDWDYLEYEPLDVNQYEFQHPPRRCMKNMGINYYQRMNILSVSGFTASDIKLATKEVNYIKLRRSITRQVLTYDLLRLEAKVESACRKTKRLIKKDHWKQEKHLFM